MTERAWRSADPPNVLGNQLRVVRRLVVELPGAARVAHVAVGEVCGPASECAVGVELDAAEREPRIAEGAVHSRVDDVIEEVAEHVHADAGLELILLGQTQVHVEFTPGHLAVTDGGDATGQELVLSDRQLAKVLFRLVLEMEVGAVMADLHSVDAGENVARGVGELTGEFAVFISEELATGRILGARVDTVLVESEGVDDAAVTARVHEVDLAIGGHLIELFLERVTPFDQVAVLVAVSANRDARRCCERRFLK